MSTKKLRNKKQQETIDFKENKMIYLSKYQYYNQLNTKRKK